MSGEGISSQIATSGQVARNPLLTSEGPLGITFITVIYGGLLAYFLFQLIQASRGTRKLQGEVSRFDRSTAKTNVLLCLLMVGLGVLSCFNKKWVDGAIMVGLGVVFFYFMKSPIYLAENGILSNNVFVPWNEVKKWAWDPKKGDLVLLIKERGKAESNTTIHVGTDLMEAVNLKIRELKLGK
ncbi:DUF5673 domain-containing protein [Kallipyga massiliensis]|uniref:DUF5673 domain-containing protein n=1 Tax=Kallipyga massiliensis TaxID=1472764 RepID=UPI0004B71656|nr:DUF5673 domain-containing protein [Kallipyga massiliensis]